MTTMRQSNHLQEFTVYEGDWEVESANTFSFREDGGLWSITKMGRKRPRRMTCHEKGSEKAGKVSPLWGEEVQADTLEEGPAMKRFGTKNSRQGKQQACRS